MRDFINYLHRAGFPPFSEADIKDTGGESVLIRAKDDRQGKKSLYFSLSVEQGRAFGHWYSCKAGVGDIWFSKSGKDWTPEEKEAWKAKAEAIRAQAAEQKRAEHEETAGKCKIRYSECSPALGDHPYAARKGITIPPKVRQDGENLVIPAIDLLGKIWTLQDITPDGDKLFTWRGRKDGTFFPIGLKLKEPPNVIFFCEGFATGCTVYEAVGTPTIVCWDAGNLMSVLKSFRAEYPKAQFIIAADNDQWTFKNPKPKQLVDISAADVSGDDSRWDVWRRDLYTLNVGYEKAGAAAAQYSARVVLPEIPADDIAKRTDFNDMGVEYTRDRLLGSLASSFPNEPEAVPEEVEHLVPPSLTAPSPGDEFITSDYDPHAAMYSFDVPKEIAKVRSDGNPMWFTDMIWDKEPGEYLTSINAIKEFHSGKSLSNLITFTRGYYPGLFVHNEFKDEIIVLKHPPWLSRNEKFSVHTLTDSDVVNYTAHIEHYGFTIGKDRVRDAIVSISEKDKIHPARKFFNALIWDGIPRIDTWLADYADATAQDQMYVSAVSARWLIAGAARVFEPGCKFDHMLVLEGKTDIGKSALLREIATFGTDVEESYFSDAVSMKDFDRPFAAMLWQGNLVLEFAELDGMDKASINTVKAWITRQEDVYQPKFSNDKKHRPRQFILAGTTNEETWMIDSTGNKRFWPVKCQHIDIPALRSVKEQLWAEAVARYKAGEPWWLSDTDPVYSLAKSEQASRMVGDAWEDVIAPKLNSREWLTMQDAYEFLGIPITQRDKGTDSRIKAIMRGQGYEWRISYSNTKHHNRVWVKA